MRCAFYPQDKEHPLSRCNGLSKLVNWKDIYHSRAHKVDVSFRFSFPFWSVHADELLYFSAFVLSCSFLSRGVKCSQEIPRRIETALDHESTQNIPCHKSSSLVFGSFGQFSWCDADEQKRINQREGGGVFFKIDWLRLGRKMIKRNLPQRLKLLQIVNQHNFFCWWWWIKEN